MDEQRWSTAGLGPDAALDYWREVVAEAFVPVSVQAPARDEPFHGAVRARPFGSLGVAVIDAGPQHVERAPAADPGPAEQVFFLNLPLRGTSVVRQGGRTSVLRPGDFALLDAAQPFELDFPDAFEQLSLVIPASLVSAQPVAGAGGVGGVGVCGAAGAGHVASCALQALVHEDTWSDRGASDLVARQLVALVALAAGSALPAAPGAPRRLLLQGAMDQVERGLSDVALCPATVAHEIGVSVRYLHRLFADEGTTFGRYLLARRLERCHRDLLDPGLREEPVSLTARRHGLPDPAYFARVYRARFGLTPREARRSAAARTG